MPEPLKLLKPDFDDPLTDLIIELDHLRKRRLYGTTPPYLFFQLKSVFHLLESLGSARIENNHTTLAEVLESRDEPATGNESLREIENIESAMRFLEETLSPPAGTAVPLSLGLVRELHRRTVDQLSPNREGDDTPGAFRTVPVRIAGANHVPPEAGDVPSLMTELVGFLNQDIPERYDLIRIAIAHHRFAWIHPFKNGNGRTVRLFTYAMLIKSGFNVGGKHQEGRLLNPTAIFCSDRQRYYDLLSLADQGSDHNLLVWCQYVLSGLKTEIDKLDRLLDYPYLKTEILAPAIQALAAKKDISPHESKILHKVLDQYPLQNQDARTVLPNLGQVQVSRILAGLRERHLLATEEPGGRKYYLGISRGHLLREVMRQLDAKGFLPLKGEV